MSAPRRSNVALSSIIQIAHDAPDIDQAIDRFAAEFRQEYGLWMVSAAVFMPTGHARIVALWSAGDRLMDVGTDILITLTPETEKTGRQLLAGSAAIIDVEAVDWGLVGDVLKRENVRSWLGVPLRFDDQLGVLSMVSVRKDAFTMPDLVFFTGVAAGISQRFGDLILSSGRI